MSSAPEPHKLEKLPLWVREYIRKLERDNDNLQTKLAAASGEETPIEIDPYTIGKTLPRRFIDKYSTIRFTCADKNHVDVRLKGDGVDIFSNGFGRASLVILPKASNHFHIGFAEVKE